MKKRHHRKHMGSASYGREIASERKALAKASHGDIRNLSKLTHGRKRAALGRAW
jgi:hypothetical protein